MQGRLRSLGRFLQTVGERLADAAVEYAEHRVVSEAELRSCGRALGDAAEALLRERWTEAEECLQRAARLDYAVLPGKHLAALQALVDGSSDPLDVRASLIALGKALEEHAESLGDALHASQDAFFDAAGALRAGARLFAMPRARPSRRRAEEPTPGTWRRGAQKVAVGASARHPPGLLAELRLIMAEPSAETRKAKLRTLAKRYHPDRHPGREMEVLPSFMHIQRLRESDKTWAYP